MTPDAERLRLRRLARVYEEERILQAGFEPDNSQRGLPLMWKRGRSRVEFHEAVLLALETDQLNEGDKA